MTPLTVPEARAILAADEALDRTFKERDESGKTLGAEERDAWITLVASATERVSAYDKMKIVATTADRGGYTARRLIGSDLSVIAEMLRVSLEDAHWSAAHSRLREIREKMIERLGDNYPGGSEPVQTLAAEAVAARDARKSEAWSVLACREGSSWVVQAIEEDVASQGDSLLGALADLGRMFDARDHLLTTEKNIAPNPRAPVDYEHALVRAWSAGDYVGVLPLGSVRVAQVYIGISPFERRTP